MTTRQLLGALIIAAAIPAIASAQTPADPPRQTSSQGMGAGAKMQPQLVDEIVPEYPPALLAARVSGVVVVDLILDEQGNVKDAHIFGRPTDFDETVIQTIKQWKFKLALLNGVPFTPPVRRTFTFTADTKKVTVTDPNAVASPYRVGGDIRPPRQTKRVEPTYPPDAVAARTGGMVILEAVIDKEGKVKNLRVLRHVTPSLDRAAMTAVEQWEYEPTLLNGVPVEVIFTVTMNFSIR